MSRNRDRNDITHYMRVYIKGRYGKQFVPFELAEFKAYFEIVKGSYGRLLWKSDLHKAPGAPNPIADIQRKKI